MTRYPASMHPEQAIIADWTQRVLTDKGWNLADCARASGVDATTIGRATKPDSKHVTKIETLHAIAKAAQIASPLDFLSGGLESAPAKMIVPSEEALASILAVLLPLVPKGRQTAQSLRVVASALHYGLELLGDQIANPDAGQSLGVAARAAVARFRDLTQE